MKLYWLFYIRNKSKNKRYQYLSYFIPAHSNLLTSLSPLSFVCLHVNLLYILPIPFAMILHGDVMPFGDPILNYIYRIWI